MTSSLGAGNIAISVIFPLAALVLVALRLRARRSNASSWYIDDYMAIFALLSVISYGVINILAVARYSLGDHVAFILLTDIVELFKLSYANGLVMIIASTFAKLSILYFYRRVLPPYRKSIITTILLVLVYAWGVGFLATNLFSCIPISKHWDPRDGGYCYSTAQQDEAFDISNLGINLIILSRPLAQAGHFRHMPRRMQAWIGGSVVLGLLVVIVTIIRVVLRIMASSSIDSTYNLAKLSITAQLESSLLVICACVLSLASSQPVGDKVDKQEEVRYEKPELDAEHTTRPVQELHSTPINELPVPDPELVGTEQFHQLDDTSINRQREDTIVN
ncbi:hypothetical protein F4679DRAFT_552532 [Xylaria curta]|nr:hypothetical protein F4679DRAFT_552532 [Xylaria curta]